MLLKPDCYVRVVLLLRLAGNSNANRYGYTWSNSAIPTIIVS